MDSKCRYINFPDTNPTHKYEYLVKLVVVDNKNSKTTNCIKYPSKYIFIGDDLHLHTIRNAEYDYNKLICSSDYSYKCHNEIVSLLALMQSHVSYHFPHMMEQIPDHPEYQYNSINYCAIIDLANEIVNAEDFICTTKDLTPFGNLIYGQIQELYKDKQLILQTWQKNLDINEGIL